MGAHFYNYPSGIPVTTYSCDTSIIDENGVRTENPYDLESPSMCEYVGSYSTSELAAIRKEAEKVGVKLPESNEGLVRYLEAFIQENSFSD